MLVAAAVTVTLWLGIEAWAWRTGRPLITDRVRSWNQHTGGLPALLFGLGAGGLGAHFFWCG